MIKKSISIIIILTSITIYSFAGENKYFAPLPRAHSGTETLSDAGILYALHWAGYIIEFKVIRDWGGNFETYKANLFLKNIQWWDGDSFWYNFVGHPYVGSQTYLYYRGRGYSRLESFAGSFTASFLFESTIEIMHEPFSFNDAVITPTFGFVLGNWIEKTSLRFINSSSKLKKAVARIINPSLNFKFYEGVSIIPILSNKMSGCMFVCMLR
jgi:hypothetical protein